MGLSVAVVYISEPNSGFDAAIALGLIRSNASSLNTSEDGFVPKDKIRIATRNNWSIIIADAVRLINIRDPLSSILDSISVGKTVFCWVNQSTEGYVLFELHKEGICRRKRLQSEGQILEDRGIPLPEEDCLLDENFDEDKPCYDEWSMFKLAEALVGISEDEHFELQGNLYLAQ